MVDIAFRSARRLAAMVGRGQIGCLELLDHYLARIERYDGTLNAVVVRDFERARKRARALDRKGEPTGPLHGVPMTVKESFDIAGLPTTWGVPAKRNDVAATNALAVDRLQDAGAVVFGKTNVPLMLGDWQSYNEIYGVTNNPWSLAHSPGGSSGGGAAALAAGLTGLECGSDIGGSIRQPAHACGLFGHKPTWNLLPTRGHAPAPDIAATLDITVIGPLARSAEDLALAFSLLAGPDKAVTDMTYALPPPRGRRFQELRIAVWPDDPATLTDPEISAMLRDLARDLRREGAKVSTSARPAFDPASAFELYMKLLSGALMGRASPEDIQRVVARAKHYAPDDRSANAIADRTVPMVHGTWLALNEQRHKIIRSWSAFFQDWDVLLCPVLAVPALPHNQQPADIPRRISIGGQETTWDNMLFWPGITGAFHLPASTAPLGRTRDGLPVGVQIVGPLYGDRTTLAVARLLEKSWMGFDAPPGWE